MPTPLSRRQFLAASAVAALGPAFRAAAAGNPPKHILLRSSWQTVNIGDIAHTPGMLRLIARYLPEAKVTLWPSKVDRNVAPMLRRAFPRLEIAQGAVDRDGKPVGDELTRAFADADFMLHGSGPSVVAANHLDAWHRTTGKPFGVYGVTLGTVDAKLRDLLSAAAFVFCRDTDSLKYLRDDSGVKGPVTGFAPDAAFAVDLADDDRASAFLRENHLEDGKFVCAIPRLRYTPYPNLSDEEKVRRADVNEKFKDADHAKLREAIVACVRKTGVRVLACPEMTYQLDLLQPLLIDPLPDDVKQRVVRRQTYWLTDEAASVYARAAAIVSFEMHSPILAVARGTPAIHLRQPTDTRKGQMWRDIGLGDWLFEIEKAKGADIADALLSIVADPAKARVKVAAAMDIVHARQRETMAVLARSV